MALLSFTKLCCSQPPSRGGLPTDEIHLITVEYQCFKLCLFEKNEFPTQSQPFAKTISTLGRRLFENSVREGHLGFEYPREASVMLDYQKHLTSQIQLGDDLHNPGYGLKIFEFFSDIHKWMLAAKPEPKLYQQQLDRVSRTFLELQTLFENDRVPLYLWKSLMCTESLADLLLETPRALRPIRDFADSASWQKHFFSSNEDRLEPALKFLETPACRLALQTGVVQSAQDLEKLHAPFSKRDIRQL